MGDFIIVLAILLGIAIVLHAGYVFTLIYFILGVYGVGLWWSKRSLKNISFRRSFVPHAFLGEDIKVDIVVENQSLLPVAWVRLYESLPVELSTPTNINQVITLGPHGRVILRYSLHAGKRGYYPVGPLFSFSGDLLGISSEQQGMGDVDYLTVYPRIITFTNVRFPSLSPQNLLPSSQIIFEDPTRIWGKRDYMVGDSLRRVDWKATAVSGRLQVKQFEPSIASDTMIFLNLYSSDYEARYRIDSIEFAIVVAASLASWIVKKKQSVGFITNGVDQTDISQCTNIIPSRKGYGHLTNILESLSRLQPAEMVPIQSLLDRESRQLSWGTTSLLITGKADDTLLENLFQLRKRGINPVIILVGRNQDSLEIMRKLKYFGIAAFRFMTERDLDIWRQ